MEHSICEKDSDFIACALNPIMLLCSNSFCHKFISFALNSTTTKPQALIVYFLHLFVEVSYLNKLVSFVSVFKLNPSVNQPQYCFDYTFCLFSSFHLPFCIFHSDVHGNALNDW